MEKSVFLSSFAAIFIAELGDKTQLATLSLASGSRARWMVFAGSALALVCTSAIAVLAGDFVSRFVSPIWLRRAAGLVFLVLGSIYLLGAGRD